MNFSPCEYGEENGEYGRLECAEGMELVVVKLLPALRVPQEKELKKENKLTLILYKLHYICSNRLFTWHLTMSLVHVCAQKFM